LLIADGWDIWGPEEDLNVIQFWGSMAIVGLGSLIVTVLVLRCVYLV
jgi:hypothetical protein